VDALSGDDCAWRFSDRWRDYDERANVWIASDKLVESALHNRLGLIMGHFQVGRPDVTQLNSPIHARFKQIELKPHR
jgi:hypothetical protein